jgi:hypothetical protein
MIATAVAPPRARIGPVAADPHPRPSDGRTEAPSGSLLEALAPLRSDLEEIPS